MSEPSALESLLVCVPGAATPLGRVAVFGGSGMAFAYFVRPEVSFHADGSPRKWIVTNGEDKQATLFPWWAWGVVPAVLFGILI